MHARILRQRDAVRIWWWGSGREEEEWEGRESFCEGEGTYVLDFCIGFSLLLLLLLLRLLLVCVVVRGWRRRE